MDNNPWELLDIDGSDLPSIVCPTNHSYPPIQQDICLIRLGPYKLEPFPTQEFIMCAHQVAQWSIDYTFDRVHLTVIIVKSCTFNDPTGTIDATMKHTIIEDQDCSPYMMDIHVGGVVFCPFPRHSKCYLNIILYNVVKVMFLHFRLPIILVFTSLHCILICCSYLTQVFPNKN
ncbi:hypothetical protein GmHk_01G000396 [Glycine max]|nr:hypothetical protein GmHk_01G000396 [Glycine max]